MDVPKKIRERKVKPKAEAIREMMRIHEAEQQQQLTMKEKLESSQIVRSAASKACSRCRKSHLRCDNYRPCQRCIVVSRATSF